MDVTIRGADDIARVAAECRRLGNGREIPNQMAREIRSAVPPIRAGVRANAATYLPKRGGFASIATRTNVRASVRRGARTAGVRIIATRKGRLRKADTAAVNRGVLRHPLWGNRERWYTTKVKAGFVTDAVAAGADEFRDACVRSVDKAVRAVFG